MLEFYFTNRRKSFRDKSSKLAEEIAFVLKNESIKIEQSEEVSIPHEDLS